MQDFIKELKAQFNIKHDDEDIEWACHELGIDENNRYWTHFKTFRKFFNPLPAYCILDMRQHIRAISEKFEDVADQNPKVDMADFELQVAVEKYETMVTELINQMYAVDSFLFEELYVSVAVNVVNEIDEAIRERQPVSWD